MDEIKTDLFPENLRVAKNREENKAENKTDDFAVSSMTPAEPLPESERPRKDGPGGE